MPATIDNAHTTADEGRVKSDADLREEYERLLKDYARLRSEVESDIRQMRGGRVCNWDMFVERLMHFWRGRRDATRHP